MIEAGIVQVSVPSSLETGVIPRTTGSRCETFRDLISRENYVSAV